MLKILIRAGLALILAAVFTKYLEALIQLFYPVGEAAAFVISYVILLLLLIRPYHMNDAVDQEDPTSTVPKNKLGLYSHIPLIDPEDGKPLFPRFTIKKYK